MTASLSRAGPRADLAPHVPAEEEPAVLQDVGQLEAVGRDGRRPVSDAFCAAAHQPRRDREAQLVDQPCSGELTVERRPALGQHDVARQLRHGGREIDPAPAGPHRSHGDRGPVLREHGHAGPAREQRRGPVHVASRHDGDRLIGSAGRPIVLGPHRGSTDEDHVSQAADDREHGPVPRSSEAAGGAVDGGGPVDAGDHVDEDPRTVGSSRPSDVLIGGGQPGGVEAALGGGQEAAHGHRCCHGGHGRRVPATPGCPTGDKWATTHREIHRMCPFRSTGQAP